MKIHWKCISISFSCFSFPAFSRYSFPGSLNGAGRRSSKPYTFESSPSFSLPKAETADASCDEPVRLSSPTLMHSFVVHVLVSSMSGDWGPSSDGWDPTASIAATPWSSTTPAVKAAVESRWGPSATWRKGTSWPPSRRARASPSGPPARVTWSRAPVWRDVLAWSWLSCTRGAADPRRRGRGTSSSCRRGSACLSSGPCVKSTPFSPERSSTRYKNSGFVLHCWFFMSNY